MQLLQFTGKRADARATECLLVFDPDTNSFTLEHQPQIYQFSSTATAIARNSASTTEESKTNSTTLLLPTPQSNANTTKSSVDHVKPSRRTAKSAQSVSTNQKVKPSSSPSAPCDDFEDVFIEIDPTVPSSSSMARNTAGSINQQKPPIYAPVTVNASNIFSSTNVTATATDIYSSTSSEDNDDDDDNDDASGTSSDSGSSSSGSSGSSSGSDDSDSSTDSDEDGTSNVPLNKDGAVIAKPLPPIQSPIDDNAEMSIDDLESAIAAAMEGVEEKEHDGANNGHSGADDDDDDNYDWLQNEIEAEMS
ncbi:hypothetical protein BDF22DRAFT_479709 [Syncephalis plumigaleata]|nr:hypothetical protein BDF22DRAFT_479709 [Syncephalis plumigaleata]